MHLRSRERRAGVGDILRRKPVSGGKGDEQPFVAQNMVQDPQKKARLPGRLPDCGRVEARQSQKPAQALDILGQKGQGFHGYLIGGTKFFGAGSVFHRQDLAFVND
jgi:hypothetical protein